MRKKFQEELLEAEAPEEVPGRDAGLFGNHEPPPSLPIFGDDQVFSLVLLEVLKRLPDDSGRITLPTLPLPVPPEEPVPAVPWLVPKRGKCSPLLVAAALAEPAIVAVEACVCVVATGGLDPYTVEARPIPDMPGRMKLDDEVSSRAPGVMLGLRLRSSLLPSRERDRDSLPLLFATLKPARRSYSGRMSSCVA